MIKKLNFAIFLLISVYVTECLANKVIETNIGKVRGYEATDGDYYQFLGIPYAKVDESNPFGASSSHPKMDGVFEANDDSRICPQIQMNGTFMGSFDCLNLNVYVPSTATSTSQLPVMIWIHGGYFARGYSATYNFGPKFLIQHDVIIVSINYRIGPYGFMCLDIPEVPGNQGLKDQILAFKWVKENIQAFGGNPDEVTLFGSSAGGHSIDLHLLSGHDKLYKRVIIQSGSSVAATVLYEPDKEAPFKLAAQLGHSTTNINEALSFLVNANTHDVLRAVEQSNIEFKPCAEQKFEGVDAFITYHWINREASNARGVPIMVGFCEHERMMTHLGKDSEHFQNSANVFYKYINQTFDFDDASITRMKDYVRRFYMGDSAITIDTVWQLINFESDFIYVHPIQRSIKNFVEAEAENVFYYMFSYFGDRSRAKLAELEEGAAHADDVRYLFDRWDLPEQISTQDQIMIDRMTTMWTNFAKYSDPTPETTNLLPVKWTPLSAETYHYLKIDSEMTTERRPFNQRMAFWDVFYRLNKKHQRGFEEYTEEKNDDNSSAIVSAAFVSILLPLLLMALIGE